MVGVVGSSPIAPTNESEWNQGLSSNAESFFLGGYGNRTESDPQRAGAVMSRALIAALMLVSLAACGGGGDAQVDAGSSPCSSSSGGGGNGVGPRREPPSPEDTAPAAKCSP